MKIKLDSFYYYSFVVILFLIFLVGGGIQYFLGVPNTVYTLLILSIIYLLILFNILSTRKLLISKVILTCLIYLFFILLSSFVNRTEPLKVILYSIFALIPLGVYYLYSIIENRHISLKPLMNSFFRILALIQLPIILIQKYGYDILIKFNNSNQNISDYDAMFGSFFIKADHSLGFFLLMYIISIIFKIRRKEIKLIPWFLLLYLTVTIFIMESNLTKLMLILVFLYYLFLWIYKKIKLLGIGIMLLISFITFNLALKDPAINGEVQSFKKKYTPEQSFIAFEKGYAKRPQIVITYVSKIPIKWLGDGPYDYYNIFTGKFKQTLNFSQLIWTYNDLGIFGLLTVILLAFFLIKSLSLDPESKKLFFLVILMYLFMTTVFSDLAMTLSLLLIRNNKIESLDIRES